MDSLPSAVGYWRKILRGQSTQNLFTLGEQVEELQRNDGFGAVMNLVKQGREALVRGATEGPTRDLAQYARLMGNIAGLDDLQHICTAILEAVASRRDEEEKRIAAEGRATTDQEEPS